jgi:hypothetical protein
MKSKLKPPGTERLKVKCDVLLSTSAFKCNLRRYVMVRSLTLDNTAERLFVRATFSGTPAGFYAELADDTAWPAEVPKFNITGRGLHSSTDRLNASAFYEIYGMHLGGVWGCLGGVTGYQGVFTVYFV